MAVTTPSLAFSPSTCSVCQARGGQERREAEGMDQQARKLQLGLLAIHLQCWVGQGRAEGLSGSAARTGAAAVPC